MTTTNKKNLKLSCEFFPPKTKESLNNLINVVQALSVIKPDILSVTYGAGGSTQDYTFDTIKAIQALDISPVAPHLTCIGATKKNIEDLITLYKKEGFRHIVALRGDLPNGMSADTGEFKYANELVEFIREISGDYFHLYVAAYPEFHPEAPNPKADINALVNKFKAGANEAMTQYFFNADSYLYLRDELEKKGINNTLIPGIMPVSNYAQLARFSNMCGTEIPKWFKMVLERFDDDTAGLKEFSNEMLGKMCQRLIKEGVDHFHFYTLNQADSTLKITEMMG